MKNKSNILQLHALQLLEKDVFGDSIDTFLTPTKISPQQELLAFSDRHRR